MAATKPDSHVEFIDYLMKITTPEEILGFQASDEAQARARDLIERASAGALTEGERLELDRMQHTDRVVSVLKTNALKALKQRDKGH